MAEQKTPTSLERFEIKFIIPKYLVEPISDYLEVYCEMDDYSAKSPDKFYTVNNLYFDTSQFMFLKNRLDDTGNRFNLRVRSYGNESGPPYFFEIKQKVSGYLRKYRGFVNGEDWPAYLGESVVSDDKYLSDNKNIRLFQRMVYSYGATPKILTQYRRKAYASLVDSYARATFDIDLRYMEQREYELFPVDAKMTHYDHSNSFEPECEVVLELKCFTNYVPLWMIDLVRHFNLKTRGFSKYASGILDHLGYWNSGWSNRLPAESWV